MCSTHLNSSLTIDQRGFSCGKMGSMWGIGKEDDQMDLPPGFRFHPTDEELITHYLTRKVVDRRFCARAIGEVDLNKSEPWELPCECFIKHIFVYL